MSTRNCDLVVVFALFFVKKPREKETDSRNCFFSGSKELCKRRGLSLLFNGSLNTLRVFDSPGVSMRSFSCKDSLNDKQ